MGQGDNDIDIRIKTQADLKAAEATIKSVEKLTAATKENAKAAAESAKVFNEAAKARNNSADQAGYVSGLTKMAKETGLATAVTERFTLSKAKLLDAAKKLTNQLPAVGLVVSTLRNPYVLLATGIGIATSELFKFFEQVKRAKEAQDVFNPMTLSIKNFQQVLAANETSRKKFVEDLKAAATAAQSVADRLGAANAVTDKMFPEDERARDAARVINLGNARREAANRADTAKAALPAAEGELDVATIQAEKADRFATSQAMSNNVAFEFEGKTGRAALVAQILALEDQQSDAGPEQKVRGLDEAKAQLKDLDATDAAAERGQRSAQERLRRASARVSTLRTEADSNTNLSRELGFQERDAANLYDKDTAAGAPRVGPELGGAGRGSLQFRYDAQRSFQHDLMMQRDGGAVAAIVKQALEAQATAIANALLFNARKISDVQRTIESQSQNSP